MAALCRGVMSRVVNVEIPEERLDDLFEMIEKAEKSSHVHEEIDFFAQQNEATQHMAKLVSETYDAMVASMEAEIAAVLK